MDNTFFESQNDYREYLAHYGVKGMRWRHRKAQIVDPNLIGGLARRKSIGKSELGKTYDKGTRRAKGAKGIPEGYKYDKGIGKSGFGKEVDKGLPYKGLRKNGGSKPTGSNYEMELMRKRMAHPERYKMTSNGLKSKKPGRGTYALRPEHHYGVPDGETAHRLEYARRYGRSKPYSYNKDPHGGSRQRYKDPHRKNR